MATFIGRTFGIPSRGCLREQERTVAVGVVSCSAESTTDHATFEFQRSTTRGLIVSSWAVSHDRGKPMGVKSELQGLTTHLTDTLVESSTTG